VSRHLWARTIVDSENAAGTICLYYGDVILDGRPTFYADPVESSDSCRYFGPFGPKLDNYDAKLD